MVKKDKKEESSTVIFPTLSASMGGFKIVFKNARIYAEKVFLEPIKIEKKR